MLRVQARSVCIDINILYTINIEKCHLEYDIIKLLKSAYVCEIHPKMLNTDYTKVKAKQGTCICIFC